MIKKIFQKYKSALIALVITAIVSSAVASGYFMVQNEKKKSSQQVESLQKSIEELQAKTGGLIQSENYEEVSQEPGKDISAPETATQQATVKKNAESSPAKTEDPEEKIVSCVAFNGKTLKVSESECETIKQSNVVIQKALDKYDDCIEDAKDELAQAKARFQDQLSKGYNTIIEDQYNEKVKEYNDTIKKCLKARNAVLEKFVDD